MNNVTGDVLKPKLIPLLNAMQFAGTNIQPVKTQKIGTMDSAQGFSVQLRPVAAADVGSSELFCISRDFDGFCFDVVVSKRKNIHHQIVWWWPHGGINQRWHKLSAPLAILRDVPQAFQLGCTIAGVLYILAFNTADGIFTVSPQQNSSKWSRDISVFSLSSPSNVLELISLPFKGKY